MQMFALLFPGAATALGIGGTAGAAATTAAATAPAWLQTVGTVAQVAGTVGKGLAAYSAMNYNAKVAEQAADTARDMAVRSGSVAATQAQDIGFEAADQLATVRAQQAASGLAVGSSSFVRRRRANQVVARTNASRIINQGAAESYKFLNEAADLRGEAQQYRQKGRWALASIPLNLVTDQISSAALARRRKAGDLQIERVGI